MQVPHVSHRPHPTLRQNRQYRSPVSPRRRSRPPTRAPAVDGRDHLRCQPRRPRRTYPDSGHFGHVSLVRLRPSIKMPAKSAIPLASSRHIFRPFRPFPSPPRPRSTPIPAKSAMPPARLPACPAGTSVPDLSAPAVYCRDHPDHMHISATSATAHTVMCPDSGNIGNSSRLSASSTIAVSLPLRGLRDLRGEISSAPSAPL